MRQRFSLLHLAAAAVASAAATSALLLLTARPALPESTAAARAWDGWNQAALQILLSTRVCGSPAVDGYAHVDPKCLELSPTNTWWQRAKPAAEDLIVHIERGADYDGIAVAWGIGNKKASLEECALACKRHVPPGVGAHGQLPCNLFTYCGAPSCWTPDVHKHTEGDCWLKFAEAPTSPEVNMRGNISAAMRQRHPTAGTRVTWSAGVLLPRGVALTNGTWGPRYDW